MSKGKEDTMMETSSINNTCCFEFALDYLAWLDKSCNSCFDWYPDIWKLKMEVRLLKTFFLYVRNCRRRRRRNSGDGETCVVHDHENKGNAMSETLRLSTISLRIQEFLNGMTRHLHLAYLRYIHSRALDRRRIIHSELNRSRENIKFFLETDIKKSCILTLLDYHSLGDPRLVMDLLDSLVEYLDDLRGRKWEKLIETLQGKLMLLRNLIGLATVQGVEYMQLIDLLIHVEVVAARLISVCRFDRDDEVFNEMEYKISQLIQEKINPVDPHVQETYIHVLTASKQSRSSCASALEENEYAVVNFVDSLLDYLMDLLGSYTSFQVHVKEQLLKLHQKIRFMSIVLRKKFNGLHDELKDVIGVVACDAGILMFTLSENEMKEGLTEETDLALFHLLKVLKYIMAEVAHMYPLISQSSFSFPRTNESGSIDLFLENLKELASCDETDHSLAFPLDSIHTVQKDLTFLRSFLENIKEKRNQNDKLKACWNRVMEVAYKAELVIDSIVVSDKGHYFLDAVAEDINLMKIEAQEICDSISYNDEIKRVTRASVHMPSQLTAAMYNEDLVGLGDEVETITDRLTRGTKQLDVVPIVGMAGLGKTTLAIKVYSDPSIKLHFHIHAWCYVSQVYSNRNLLVQILCSIDSRNPNQYVKIEEDVLAVELYQRLKGHRYLIVLDDMWDIGAWNLLRNSLPDDANGSRIMFTSRYQNFSSLFKGDCKPHHLRQLTDEECWALLQTKIFGQEGCPPILSEVGFRIATNCKGLPLIVVLVSGILATTDQDCWEETAETLNASIILDTGNCMKTLEQSYSHLPDYLKPCLLYFSAFTDERDISVQRLLRLYISEGFVQKTERKSLEEVANDCLMDLIARSLVMVTRERTLGGAKACRVHDLVHEFCVEKSKLEGFLHIIDRYKDPSCPTGPCNYNPHRLCIYNTMVEVVKQSRQFFPNLRCLLFFPSYEQIATDLDLGFLMSKLLRVLDLGNFDFCESFPLEVLCLVHLRYLGINLKIDFVPSAIANLSRLHTLVVYGSITHVELPKTIWNIKTLRHLCVKSYYIYGFSFSSDNLEESPDLVHLETLNLVIDPSSQSLQKILKKLPNIRRLKCVGVSGLSTASSGICYGTLMLDHLSLLESLKVVCAFEAFEFEFPLNLRKLTLSCNDRAWSEISAIGKLPNLEVLKVRDSFVGEEWEMKEGEFCNLRYLELSDLGFCRWTASADNFPRLEKLVLHYCEALEEVPSCLGECSTLEMIEVKGCSESAVCSVKQIGQEQMEMGNQGLKIVM